MSEKPREPHVTGITGRVLGELGGSLDRMPVWAVILVAIGATVLVATVDWYTGHDVDLAIFYVGPVALATWLVAEWAGFAIALISALVWIAADPSIGTYSNGLVPFWNAAVRLSFLLLTIFFVSVAKRAIESEMAASRTDALTGVANSRAFHDRATLAIAEMQRSRDPLTFCFIDLDHFKRVNDTLGHHEGDALLVVVATAISTRLRATDLVARLGGDEFGVLLPGTDYDAAKAVIADLSAAVRDSLESRWPVGLTGGAVTFVQPPSGVDQMVSAADELMYSAKNAGRGRILHEVWPSPEAFEFSPESAGPRPAVDSV